jgi:beta-aspartyl-dipeptidase (metallo-type)
VIVLVSGGDTYTPEPLGRAAVLAVNGTVTHVGQVDSAALESLAAALKVEMTTLDASGSVVVPGLIDPHVHLIGGSGEQGYATWTPEIGLWELLDAGVTTVVGCLGVDTTMKAMPTLAGKAKALAAQGLTAYVYSGGYDVPPVTLTGSVRRDMLLVNEVIGAGETAIADARGAQPGASELARLVADAYVGGLLTGKCGVTHFHVGDGPRRLEVLRTLLDDYDVSPESLYPTHVERTPELLAEAVALTHRGVTVDVDTVGGDLLETLEQFVAAGGDMQRLTVSSDAAITPPRQRLTELARCAATAAWPLERLLPLVTTTPAARLKLPTKGRLQPGADADVLVLSRPSLQPRHVVARGRVLMQDGVFTPDPGFQGAGRRSRIDGQAT